MPLSKRDIEWDYAAYGRYAVRKQSPVRKNNYGYANTPRQLAEVRYIKPKKTAKRKINAKGKFVLFLLVVFFAAVVAPYFIKNVTAPVFLAKVPNKSVKADNYNSLYKPTTQYIYNTDFMNTKMLVGASKNPAMQQLFLTDELGDLKQKLNTQIAAYPRLKPAIFVWDVSNGKYVDINADTPYPAASIIKIPVLISLFKSIEAGKTNLSDTIPLEEYYRSGGSGFLQYFAQGYTMNVDNLARLMITESDNSSTNMLISEIGSMTAVNNDAKSWGLKNTYLNTWLPDLGGTNYTSPKDLATMLHNLDNESFLNIDSRANIFDYMGHVKNNRLLAAGIPDGASIAHKTGDIGTMLGDAGIVYTTNGRKYIVAIMVKRPHNDSSAKEFIVGASNTIYNYMANY